MGPQYSTCVAPKDYAPLNPGYITVLLGTVVLGGALAVLTFGISLLVAMAAFLEALRYVLDWLLHGKLICLDRDPAAVDCKCASPGLAMTCAIGEIVDTEHVGEDKNFIEDLDDDYAFNLLLLPFVIRDFVDIDYVKPDDDSFNAHRQQVMAVAAAPGQPQGDLLRKTISVTGNADEFGYLRTLVWTELDDRYRPYNEVVGRDESDPIDKWTDWLVDNGWRDAKRFNVAVMHCEFEGSRVRDVLASLEGFPFGTSFCKKNFLFNFVCRLVAALLAPLVLERMLWAWANNTEGSDAPSLLDGAVGPGEQVIVRGPWVYDAGHEGWNEIHATRTVQKVDRAPTDPAAFQDYLARWCRLTSEAGDGRVGATSSGLEGGEARRPVPEDDWIYHPDLDGCVPAREPEPGPERERHPIH